MELLRIFKKRSFLSEIAYVFLNVILAVALLVLVLIVNVPWPAFGLVLLSKWRIFAVRSRYWVANIRANLIDLIVGLSFVVFLFASEGDLFTQIVLMIMYIGWLLLLKPKSKRSYIVAQAAVGLVFGIGAIVQSSPSLPASVIVLLGWVVGYAAARHVLSIQHETHINFLSLVWGFLTAELLWLSYHWTIGYGISHTLMLSQIVVIIAGFSFLSERVYASFRKNGTIVFGDVMLPMFLSLSIIGVLLFVFGNATSI